jgi:carbamoyltransferase
LSQESFVLKSLGRFGPRHPVLGAIGSRAALPVAEWYFRRKHIHRSTSHFATERRNELSARLARGETAYLAGISIGGFHNSGVALVEVSPDAGPRILCNNEEERFNGRKHANNYPSSSLEALTGIMRRLGISPERIVAWLGTYDYPLLVSTGIRAVLEEFPASVHLMFQESGPTFDSNQFKDGICAPIRLGQLFGHAGAVPIIGMVHHDNHAWFSYLVSPFAQDGQPVMIVVVDGSGDFASISFYRAKTAVSDKSAPMAVFLTHLECFTASSARHRVAGPLSAAKVAIWARLPMAT